MKRSDFFRTVTGAIAGISAAKGAAAAKTGVSAEVNVNPVLPPVVDAPCQHYSDCVFTTEWNGGNIEAIRIDCDGDAGTLWLRDAEILGDQFIMAVHADSQGKIEQIKIVDGTEVCIWRYRPQSKQWDTVRKHMSERKAAIILGQLYNISPIALTTNVGLSV